MCGITGRVSFEGPVDRAVFGGITDALAHRGPDGAGIEYLHDGRVALGHRRLSIIDLSDQGSQPMCNETGRIWLTFNGEIYNYRALRRELEQGGHTFSSHTDSETILHGYEEWGVDCVLRLRGIFAFGLWDEDRKRLLLARDHLGVKPLYYSENGKGITFASELKALLADDAFTRKVDREAVASYLSLRYVPWEQCICEGVRKLAPAHRVIVEDGKSRVERFWQAEYRPTITDKGEAIEAVRAAVAEAVELQLVSDVPIGCLLSGGVDSSLVAALLRRHSNESIHSFTIGFDVATSDESVYAEQAARLIGTEHVARRLTRADFPELLGRFVDVYDEPLCDNSGMPFYAVSALAQAHGIKVAHSGDGGDELFAGYRWYDELTEKLVAKPPQSMWRRMLEGVFPGPDQTLEAFAGIMTYVKPAELALLLGDAWGGGASVASRHFERFRLEGAPPVTQAQYVDLHTFMMDDILTKVDRASMACGVEVRVPLLDWKLVETAFQIDGALHYQGNTRKYILRASAEGVVPRELLTERKKGFSIPLWDWLEAERLGSLLSVLDDGVMYGRGIIRPEGVARLREQQRSHSLFMIFLLEMWGRRWLEGASPDEVRGLLRGAVEAA